jgi:hypothetical protein
VSREECARLQENVPQVKIHQYKPKHLYPKLNGYGDKFETMAVVTYLLITKYILKLAGIFGFCT